MDTLCKVPNRGRYQRNAQPMPWIEKKVIQKPLNHKILVSFMVEVSLQVNETLKRMR